MATTARIQWRCRHKSLLKNAKIGGGKETCMRRLSLRCRQHAAMQQAWILEQICAGRYLQRPKHCSIGASPCSAQAARSALGPDVRFELAGRPRCRCALQAQLGQDRPPMSRLHQQSLRNSRTTKLPQWWCAKSAKLSASELRADTKRCESLGDTFFKALRTTCEATRCRAKR